MLYKPTLFIHTTKPSLYFLCKHIPFLSMLELQPLTWRFFFVPQTAHGEVISRRQNVERMTELQQSKYQDLQAALPSELSMQLAEVALALSSAEDQVARLLFSTAYH